MEYEIEGSLLEKGYDSDTKDDAEECNVGLKGGFGGSSQKKQKIVDGSDSDHEIDFVEEMVRDFQRNRNGGKGKEIKGQNYDRVSIPSDDEPLAHRMEIKRKYLRLQEERIQNSMKNVEPEIEEDGDQE